MINQLIKKYNALEGEEVSRDDLRKLSTLAFDTISYNEKIAGEIHTKLIKILDKYDKDKFVVKSLKKYSLQKLTGLKGAEVIVKEKIDKKKYPLSIIKKDVPIGTRVKIKSSYASSKDHRLGYVLKHDYAPIIKDYEYPFHTQLEYSDGTKEWVKPWSFTIYTSLEEQKHLKSVLKKAGLNAPRHNGAAKNALSECGRLKKGFKYEKGGKIVKVKKQPKKKSSVQKVSKKPIHKKKDKKLVFTMSSKKKGTRKFFFPLVNGVRLSRTNYGKKWEAQKYLKELRASKTDTWFLSKLEKYNAKSKPNQEKKLVKTPSPEPSKPVKKSVEIKPVTPPVKVDTNGQTALFGPAKQPLINFEVVESTNMVLEPEEKTAVSVPPATEVKKVVNRNNTATTRRSLADKFKTTHEREFFELNPKFSDISKLLGKVEVLKKESAVMTLSAAQGAGKSTALFQFMEAFASSGYKCLHVSLEEHVDSHLYEKKAIEYLSPEALHNIDAPSYSKNNIKELWKDIEENDVIFIDSMKKLWQFIKGVDLDNDLRKKFNGKLFIIIFQLTVDGKMRGGSDAQFDGDMIGFIHKGDRFEDNYIYFDKNRYAVDTSHPKYNIYSKSLIRDNEPTATNNNQQQPTFMNFEVVG